MSGPADYIFYAAAAMTVGAAILVAILPNILYAAVALLFSFAGVAGLYVLLSADFLAATQILDVILLGFLVKERSLFSLFAEIIKGHRFSLLSICRLCEVPGKT